MLKTAYEKKTTTFRNMIKPLNIPPMSGDIMTEEGLHEVRK